MKHVVALKNETTTDFAV